MWVDFVSHRSRRRDAMQAASVIELNTYIFAVSPLLGLSFHIRTVKWIPKNCPFMFGNLCCLIVVSCLEVTDFIDFEVVF